MLLLKPTLAFQGSHSSEFQKQGVDGANLHVRMANGWKAEHFSVGESISYPFHPDEQSACLG